MRNILESGILREFLLTFLMPTFQSKSIAKKFIKKI